MEPIHAFRQGISFPLTDRTASRITLLLLVAGDSEDILADLQTPSLSFEGMRKMADSADFASAMVLPGIPGGTIWLRADHLHDLIISLDLPVGITSVLIRAEKSTLSGTSS
jgi:hypothetical protein